jgi:hypothetical protein
MIMSPAVPHVRRLGAKRGGGSPSCEKTMNYPDAYTAAIHKLKLVLPHDSHVTLEAVLRDVYVAALRNARDRCDELAYAKSSASDCVSAMLSLIEQVKEHSHG